jgi:hypothetical protein
MASRKQLDICGRGVPLLKRVGVACVKRRLLMYVYVSMAASMSCLWMPTCGRERGVEGGVVLRQRGR